MLRLYHILLRDLSNKLSRLARTTLNSFQTFPVSRDRKTTVAEDKSTRNVLIFQKMGAQKSGIFLFYF